MARNKLRAEPEKRSSKRAALYLRISTDEKTQPWSLGAQLERGEAYCRSQGWPITRVYSDEASGTTLERKDLQQALRDAERGEFDVLVFYRIDRLSRRLVQLLEVAERLEVAGAALASVTEPFDTSTPIGRMIMQVLGAIAQFERDVIVDRIREGVEQRIRSGKWTGSLPTGLIRGEDGVPCADPDWLPVALRIFDLYGNDRLGSTVIARLLNSEGSRTKTGRPWNGKSVLTVLHSPAFIGMMRYQDELIPANFESVMDVALWERVQEVLQERGEHPHLRRGNASSYVLSGLARCGRCRSAYVGSSANGNGGLYHYYVCQGRLRQGSDFCDNDNLSREALETAVILELVELLAVSGLPEEAWELAKEAEGASRDERKKEVRRLDRQVSDKETARARYFDAFESGKLEASMCNERLAAIEEELDALRARRQVVEASIAAAETPFPSDAIDECLAAFEEVDDGSPESLKALLRILIKRITVRGQDDIRCTYRLPIGLDGEPVRPMTERVEAAGIEPASAVALTVNQTRPRVASIDDETSAASRMRMGSAAHGVFRLPRARRGGKNECSREHCQPGQAHSALQRKRVSS
jgi:site-specific DNA recombinase